LQENAEDRDGNSSFDMGSRELLGDAFSPSDDPTMNSDEGESSPVELTNLEKSISIIIDSLKQQNAGLVKDVEDLVSELCRITLLWDEMWLAALMQRQGEVHR
jgi:PI-3-kinase-related kinase SMG-1